MISIFLFEWLVQIVQKHHKFIKMIDQHGKMDSFSSSFFFFFFFKKKKKIFILKKKKKKIRDVNDSIQDFEVVMRNKKPGIVPKIVELGIILIILPKYSNKINIK